MKYFLQSFLSRIPSANLEGLLLSAWSLVSSVGPGTNARLNDFGCPSRVMDFVLAVIEQTACINTLQPKHNSACSAKSQVQIQFHSSVAMRPKYSQAPRHDRVGGSRLLYSFILARSYLASPAYKSAMSRGSFLAPFRTIHGFRVRQQRAGYITYVVLMLVLTVIGTTIALADRTNSSLAGMLRQSTLRDAELAAENGLIRTINDMNQPANRYLWGIPSSQWETWYNDYNEKKKKLYPAKDCRYDENGTQYNYLKGQPDAFEITGQALVFKHISDRAANTANYQEEWTKGFLFQVLAVTLKNKKHEVITDFSTISKTEPSFVEFRVRGTHNSLVNETTGWVTTLDYNYRNGTNQAQDHDVSFDITREYVLVPFCCKTGFLYDNQTASSNYGSKQASGSCLTKPTEDLNGDEKVGWTIVGPSATGLFRDSLQ